MSTTVARRSSGATAALLCAVAGVIAGTAVAAFPDLTIPGVSPDHVAVVLPALMIPALIRGLGALTRHLARGGGALAVPARHCASLGGPARIAAVLLFIGGVVHLALLPGHLAMEPQTGVLFALDAAGFFAVAAWTACSNHWRIPAGLMSVVTAIAYASYIHNGLEDIDVVGLITTAIELAVVPVALFDWVGSVRRRPAVRVVACAAAVATLLAACGTVANAAQGTSRIANAMAPLFPSPTAHVVGGSSGSMSDMVGPDGTMNSSGAMQGSPMTSPTGMTNSVCPSVNAMPTSDGMLMQPVPATPPTQKQIDAANQLVAQTTAGIQQYTNMATAEAAGYVSVARPNSPVVHMVNRANFSGNPLAHPSAPQALVYAHNGSTYTLLGAMYLTNGACKEGPDIGGSLTDWHAHVNLCFSTSGTITGQHPNASGRCPSGQTTHATPFMLHVYIVPNNPSGPWELSNSTLKQVLAD